MKKKRLYNRFMHLVEIGEVDNDAYLSYYLRKKEFYVDINYRIVKTRRFYLQTKCKNVQEFRMWLADWIVQ